MEDLTFFDIQAGLCYIDIAIDDYYRAPFDSKPAKLSTKSMTKIGTMRFTSI